MKISIITPSLNSEEFIENNLKSIHLSQSGDFSIEQIIVDGCSTDRTVEIISSFKKKYGANIILLQGKDQNMYDAINKGLKIMSGDIWACLNTDDMYYPEIFPLIIREFKEKKHIDVVYGFVDKVDHNEKFICTNILPKFSLKTMILANGCWFINHPATFLRRSVLDKVGYFDINYKYSSDYDYLVRVGMSCKIELIKKSFVKFRIHENSISYNRSETNRIQAEEGKKIWKKYLQENKMPEKNLRFFYTKYKLLQITSMKNLKAALYRRVEKLFIHSQL